MLSFPYKIIDLTHTLDENIPHWDEGCGFKQDNIIDYADCNTEIQFRVQQIKMQAGIGTHIDAPAHCSPHGIYINEIPLQDLIAPCVVIDVSMFAHSKYTVSLNDVKSFEQINTPINSNSLVFFRTGWEKYWDTPEQYRNHYLFPSISKDVAEYLLERGIKGIGIDTLSPDRPEDGFPVHKILLGNGKYIIENVANLKNMPIIGGFICALPLKTKGGTEAPVRLVGFKS